jgi:hypothetical protein
MIEYLTEQKLGEILNIIYPGSVIPQFKLYKRKFDYGVNIDSNTLLETLPQAIQNFYLDTPSEYALKYTGVLMLVEFDSHFHYLKNSKVIFEEVGCAWRDMCNTTNDAKPIFILRIPYWLQLNTQIIKHYFNVKNIDIIKYPHGFISKNVVLPERFCASGEDRFITELKELPPLITEEVIRSLIIKTGYPDTFTSLKIAKTGTRRLWQNLLTSFNCCGFGPSYKQILKLSPDISKIDKNLPHNLLTKYLKNQILQYAFYN